MGFLVKEYVDLSVDHTFNLKEQNNPSKRYNFRLTSDGVLEANPYV